MPKCIPEQELQSIEAAVSESPVGITAQQIADALPGNVPLRTLQYRLRHLVESGKLAREGEGRWVRYRRPGDRAESRNGDGFRAPDQAGEANPATAGAGDASLKYADILSSKGAALHRFLQQRPAPRRPSSVRRRLLDSYRPNVTAYLGRRDRGRLAVLGRNASSQELPGTEALRLGESLEIDLTWNSARLSGSRYSELDVRRLIKFGRAAESHDLLDTQSVLNQRDALRFLLASPGEIDIDRLTLCNLHAILAHNLLPDEAAGGQVRELDERFRHRRPGAAEVTGVSMDATFQRMIELAQAVRDPFEQAFFIFVQLPYLSPFAEMNDRVARFALNVPLIRHNLAPLSFVDVPAEVYADAIRGVVERSRVDLLKDVFIWGYERAAQRYGAGQLARATPDPFRLEHDAPLRSVIGEVVRQRIPRHDAASYVETWALARLPADVLDRFVRIVDVELRGLHEGNFARYPIGAVEFRAWQAIWSGVAMPPL